MRLNFQGYVTRIKLQPFLKFLVQIPHLESSPLFWPRKLRLSMICVSFADFYLLFLMANLSAPLYFSKSKSGYTWPKYVIQTLNYLGQDLLKISKKQHRKI